MIPPFFLFLFNDPLSAFRVGLDGSRATSCIRRPEPERVFKVTSSLARRGDGGNLVEPARVLVAGRRVLSIGRGTKMQVTDRSRRGREARTVTGFPPTE